MDESKPKNLSSDSVSFLLKENQRISESYWHNEELGERRVNFLITLVTAVIAGLVAFTTSDYAIAHKDTLAMITTFALVGLLAIGIVTFLRMIQRNRVTDEYKDILDAIRGCFQDMDEHLKEGYDPFKIARGDKSWKDVLKGGLAEMVAVINGIIISALLVLISRPVLIAHSSQPLPISMGFVGLTGFLVAIVLQYLYLWTIRLKKTRG